MITVLIPSRGRPEKFKRCLDSIKKTSQAEVFLYLDEDDKTIDAYPKADKVIVGPPVHLRSYQTLYENTDAKIIQMGADDLVYKNQNWDLVVEEEIDGVLSFDDGGRPRIENGHPFIERWFIEKIGFLIPKELNHSCVDNWVVDIAIGIDKFKISKEIDIRHIHPKYGLDEWDKTYKRNSRELKTLDGISYKKLIKTRNDIISRIK